MPEIPLTPPETPDIYSFGFGKNLYRSKDGMSSPVVYDQFSDAITGQQLFAGSDVNLKSVTASGFKKVISPGDDIQDAINKIRSLKGGILELNIGTYLIDKPIQVYSSITIRGLNMNETILDFGSAANNFVMEGTDIYTTGTISSISGGVNVTGSGTSWNSSMIGRQIFISNRWYVISNVISGTSLTLSSGYADGSTFSGTYRIASPIADVTFQNLTLKNSTATAITGTDVRDINLLALTFVSNNRGYSLTNFMNVIVEVVTISRSTVNGYELTNGSFCNCYSVASAANSGYGVLLNNLRSCGWILSASNVNTSAGFRIVNCDSLLLNVEAVGNGEQSLYIFKE